MYDIDDLLDPMAMLRRRQEELFARPAGPVHVPPLEEEKERGLLSRLGDWGLSSLSFAGGTLEKLFGGRAIRGLLGGQPRELLSVLPGSDLLGITREEDRVSGEKLLRDWGAIEGEGWGNTLAGIGLEMALDPVGMIGTFGTRALTEAGRVAQKVRMLPGLRGRLTGSLDTILGGIADPALRQTAQQAMELAAGGAQQFGRLRGESLGGLFGVKVPFSELFGAHAAPVLTGRAGEAVLDVAGALGRGVSATSEALGKVPLAGGLWKAPVVGPGWYVEGAPRWADTAGRYLGAWFHGPQFGGTTPEAIAAATKRSSEIMPWQAPFLEKAAGYGQELLELGATDPALLRRAIELPGHASTQAAFAASNLAPQARARVQQIADLMRGDYRTMLQEAKKLGIAIEEYGDPLHQLLQYAPRHWSSVIKAGGSFGGEGAGTAAALIARDKALMAGRQGLLEGFEEGSEGVNALLRNPQAYNQNLPLAQRGAMIEQGYLRDPAQVAQEAMGRGVFRTPSQTLADETAYWAGQRQKQGQDLAGFIQSLPEEWGRAATGNLLDKAQQPITLTAFGHDPVHEYMNYVRRYAQVRARALAAQDLVASQAILPGTFGPLQPGGAAALAALPQGSVPIGTALERAGLHTGGFIPSWMPQNQPIGAMEAILPAINERMVAAGLQPYADVTALSQAGLGVAANIPAELSRIVGSFRAPAELGPVGRAYDYLTNLFKSHVTTYWPAFLSRNLLSGQVQAVSKEGLGTLGNIPGAYRAFAGGAWEGLENAPFIRDALQAAGRPVTSEEALKQLQRWQFAYGVGGHTPHVGKDVVTAGDRIISMPVTLEQTMSQVPGAHAPAGLGKVWNIATGGDPETQWWAAHKVAGAGSPGDVFTLAKAGRAAGDIVEDLNRTPQFAYLLQQGWSPAAAAERVLGTQYSYARGTLTPFESTVMRRLVPFYSFAKQNLPAVATEMLTNPGGIAGTLARTSLGLRERGLVPEYLGSGLAIPWGEQEQGTQRYLSNLGLAPEAAFEPFKARGAAATGLGLLSQLNPILKGPLEYTTGKQFFTGRDLGDLYQTTGNRLADALLPNTPLARWLTLERTLTDPRKWAAPEALPLNLLTGVKLTDVDMIKARDVLERRYLEEEMQGRPGLARFQAVTIRPEQLAAGVSPEDYELVQLQRLLEKRAREKAAARR